MAALDGQDARLKLVQNVRDDIRQVLGSSWELQQVLSNTPRASKQATCRLSQPKHQRKPADVVAFAQSTTTNLTHLRARHKAQWQVEQQQHAATREALQGWLRRKEHERQQVLNHMGQQQWEKQQHARHSNWLVTERAKADLAALRQKQQQQREHASLLQEQLTGWHSGSHGQTLTPHKLS